MSPHEQITLRANRMGESLVTRKLKYSVSGGGERRRANGGDSFGGGDGGDSFGGGFGGGDIGISYWTSVNISWASRSRSGFYLHPAAFSSINCRPRAPPPPLPPSQLFMWSTTSITRVRLESLRLSAPLVKLCWSRGKEGLNEGAVSEDNAE